jgi:hypothetical protein
MNMAEQKITVRFDPESVDSLRRAIAQATSSKVAPVVEPITIQAPDGERFLFIDEDNQEHWVRSRSMEVAKDDGWRQAFFLSR